MVREKKQMVARRESIAWQGPSLAWKDYRALLVSCAVHTAAFVLLGLLMIPLTRGTGRATLQLGAIIATDSAEGESFDLGGSAANASDAPESGGRSAPAPTLAESSGAPISVSDIMQDLVGYAGKGNSPEGSGSGLGDGLSGTGTSGTGSGSGKTTASFMGLRGTGSSFAYVLDRSSSMDEFEGAPMRFAKEELLRSIQSLKDNHQFQIVFYNESAGALSASGGGGRMLYGNETSKEKATRFVKAIRAIGGTEHVPGIKMGLSFSPDVLFFLTDAADPAMSEAQLLEIQSRAERSMTTIHSVQFNRGEAPNDGGWIRDLAEMNRGTYRYVDITKLGNP